MIGIAASVHVEAIEQISSVPMASGGGGAGARAATDEGTVAGSGGRVGGAGGHIAAGGDAAGSGGSVAGRSGAGGNTAAAGSGGTSGQAGGSAADPDCPESGGQTWSGNGHCYFPLLAQASWNVSRDQCNAKGATLVTITSANELSFVGGLMSSTPSWIGLSKFGAPQFSWATGEALSYTNWASGEPNLSGETAVAMRSDTREWFDDAVGASHPAICERP